MTFDLSSWISPCSVLSPTSSLSSSGITLQTHDAIVTIHSKSSIICQPIKRMQTSTGIRYYFVLLFSIKVNRTVSDKNKNAILATTPLINVQLQTDNRYCFLFVVSLYLNIYLWYYGIPRLSYLMFKNYIECIVFHIYMRCLFHYKMAFLHYFLSKLKYIENIFHRML